MEGKLIVLGEDELNAKTLEALKKAKAVIGSTWNWCQFAFARTAGGLPTDASDPLATQFCVLGACRKATEFNGHNSPTAQVYFRMTTILHMAAGDVPVAESDLTVVNDYRGFDKVHEVIDKAIENFDWYAMRVA